MKLVQKTALNHIGGGKSATRRENNVIKTLSSVSRSTENVAKDIEFLREELEIIKNAS
jgi:hypothetical protein